VALSAVAHGDSEPVAIAHNAILDHRHAGCSSLAAEFSWVQGRGIRVERQDRKG
jgi:hypothetical protein